MHGPTLLLMSDHLWSPELLDRVRDYPLGEDEAVLGVDFKIDECFDLDDATKVAIRGDRVARIGKELPRYDALDTGVFRITQAVIDALERVDGPDGCSLSQGIAAAGQRRPHAGRGCRGRGLGRCRHPARRSTTPSRLLQQYGRALRRHARHPAGAVVRRVGRSAPARPR